MSVQVETKGLRRDDAVLLRGAKAHMAESVAQRKDEKPITGWRTILPLVGASISLLVAVVLVLWLKSWEAVVVGFLFLYTLTSAFVVLLNYLLAKGFVAHARREAMLRRGATEYLRTTASAAGANVETEMSNLESIERDAANTEKMPSPIYTAFGALPLVGILVTLYYLRAIEIVPAAHGKRWAAFVLQVSSSCAKLGLAPKLRSTAEMRRSRFVPFAIVTLVFPPFLVLWYHLLLGENARHLQSQWNDEDCLLQILT